MQPTSTCIICLAALPTLPYMGCHSVKPHPFELLHVPKRRHSLTELHLQLRVLLQCNEVHPSSAPGSSSCHLLFLPLPCRCPTAGGGGGERNWLSCSYQWESHLHCGGTAGSERRPWTRGAAWTEGSEGSKRKEGNEGS